MPPAAGASVPTPTQMPHVLDEAQREQLLQALEHPAFNDCKLLDWLGRVAPWDEGLAMQLASSSVQQPPLGPQLPADAAAAGPQERQEEQLQKHPLIDQDSMKQQQERPRPVSAEESGDPRLARRLAPRAAAGAGMAAVAAKPLLGEGQRDLAAGQKVEAQEAEGQTATGQRAQGRKAGSDAQAPQHPAKAVVCPASPAADPAPQRGGPHAPSQAPPGAAAAPRLPPTGATGALPASRVAAAAAASSAAVLGTTTGAPEAPGMGPQQEAAGGRRRPRSPPPIHFMPAATGSRYQQQQAAGCEQLETGSPAAAGPSPRAAGPVGTAAISSRQPQQPVNAAAGVPLSHVSEQKQIGRGRASDARQEEENQRRPRSPVCTRDRDSSRPSSRSRSRPHSRPRSRSLTRSPLRARRPRSRLRSRSPSHARSRSRSCSHTRSRSRSPSRSRSRAHECADTRTRSLDRRQDSWDVRAEEVAWARQLHEWLLCEPDRTAAVPRILR